MRNLKHFKIEEFDSPDVPGSGKNIKETTLKMLDYAREASGCAYKINSGYRTPEHNKKINGSSTSSHLGGWAIDIDCNNSNTRERIIFGLIQAGFQRIGIAKGFIHADNDPHKYPAIWLY